MTDISTGANTTLTSAHDLQVLICQLSNLYKLTWYRNAAPVVPKIPKYIITLQDKCWTIVIVIVISLIALDSSCHIHVDMHVLIL